MITVEKQGNMFSDASLSDTIVVTVNCVGVMGAGVALEFKNLYPNGYMSYRQACQKGLVKPGKPFTIGSGFIYFPTKLHWRNPSQIQWIDGGLRIIKKFEISGRLFLPALGCGNGSLHWGSVKPLIYKHLSNANFDVVLYPPKKKKSI